MTSQSNIKTLNISGTRGSYGFVKAVIEIVAKSFFKRRSAVPFGTGVFAASLDEAVAHIRAERAKEVPAN